MFSPSVHSVLISTSFSVTVFCVVIMRFFLNEVLRQEYRSICSWRKYGINHNTIQSRCLFLCKPYFVVRFILSISDMFFAKFEVLPNLQICDHTNLFL